MYNAVPWIVGAIRTRGCSANRIAMVKTGSTLAHLSSRRRDSEDWISVGMGGQPNRAGIVDLENGSRLPEPGRFAGIIVADSHAQVTGHHPGDEQTAEWQVRAAGKRAQC